MQLWGVLTCRLIVHYVCTHTSQCALGQGMWAWLYHLQTHTVANIFLLLLLDSLQIIFRSSLDGRALHRLPNKPFSGFPVKIRSAITIITYSIFVYKWKSILGCRFQQKHPVWDVTAWASHDISNTEGTQNRGGGTYQLQLTILTVRTYVAEQQRDVTGFTVCRGPLTHYCTAFTQKLPSGPNASHVA